LRSGTLHPAAASLPGYGQDVELRQLEAFAAVATELHFGRAAERLHIAPPTLSELIRRLERELGTPLFTRTTRQVALTSAGAELLTRSKVILDEAAAAKAAIRRVADGEEGTVRLGITPPAAPVLAPHLINLFTAEAPQVTVDLQRMWLPDLLGAVAAGDIDVALTCGPVSEPAGIATEVSFGDRRLAKQLSAADRAGADYAVILGEEEVASQSVMLKDLRNGGEQRRVAIGSLTEVLGRGAAE